MTHQWYYSRPSIAVCDSTSDCHHARKPSSLNGSACCARRFTLLLRFCRRADLDTISSTRKRKQQLMMSGACFKVGPVLVSLYMISVMSAISLPMKIRCHREERSRELTAQAACLIQRGRDTRCNATRWSAPDLRSSGRSACRTRSAGSFCLQIFSSHHCHGCRVQQGVWMALQLHISGHQMSYRAVLETPHSSCGAPSSALARTCGRHVGIVSARG